MTDVHLWSGQIPDDLLLYGLPQREAPSGRTVFDLRAGSPTKVWLSGLRFIVQPHGPAGPRGARQAAVTETAQGMLSATMYAPKAFIITVAVNTVVIVIGALLLAWLICAVQTAEPDEDAKSWAAADVPRSFWSIAV